MSEIFNWLMKIECGFKSVYKQINYPHYSPQISRLWTWQHLCVSSIKLQTHLGNFQIQIQGYLKMIMQNFMQIKCIKIWLFQWFLLFCDCYYFSIAIVIFALLWLQSRYLQCGHILNGIRWLLWGRVVQDVCPPHPEWEGPCPRAPGGSWPPG